MNNIWNWKIYFLLIIEVCLLISCKKDEGSLPNYDKNTPFYEDLALQIEWTDTLYSLHNDFILGKVIGVDNGILYLRITIREVAAIDLVNKTKLWQTSLDSNLFNKSWPTNIRLISNGNLNLYSSSGLAVLDALTGEIRFQKNIEQIIPQEKKISGVNFLRGKYYFTTRNSFHNPSLVDIWCFDPIADNLTLMWTSEYNMLFNQNPQIIIDEAENRLMFFYYTPSSGHQAYSIGIFNLRNNLFSSINVDNKGSITYITNNEFIVKDNYLIGNYSLTNSISAINLSNGKADWQIEGYDFTIFQDKILSIDNKMGLYNVKDGQEIWKVRTSLLNFINELAFHPTFPYFMHIENDNIQLRDFKDGQLLARWSEKTILPENTFGQELIYDSTSEELIMLSSSMQNKLYLHTFRFPFE